jgi:hypothetical protein
MLFSTNRNILFMVQDMKEHWNGILVIANYWNGHGLGADGAENQAAARRPRPRRAVGVVLGDALMG